MIGFKGCTYFHTNGVDRQVVLFDADLQFELTDRICVLAQSGSGKSTILSLLAGLLEPVNGTVHTHESLSWPVGAASGFHPALTGEENVRSLAMMLGFDPDWTSAYTLCFSELESDYYRPVGTYSAGKRARLSYSFSYAAPAAMYLAEDSVGTGSREFVQRCEAAMEQRLDGSGLFLISRSPRICERFGDRFYVLRAGKFLPFDDFDEAKACFEKIESQTSELNGLLEGFAVVE